MMSWTRIKGIAAQEGYITKRNSTIWVDLLVIATMQTLVFGLLARYLNRGGGTLAGTYVILGVILWEVLRVNQYAISVNSLWNLWSHNLSNLFIAPISTAEYVIGNCILAFLKTAAVVVVVAVCGTFLFHFDILTVGLVTLLGAVLILTVFAWAIGWLFLGFIFRYGTTVQALAWGAIYVIQPFSAVFFPLSILPPVLRDISWAFPSTYAFEAARRSLTHQGIPWGLLFGGLALDCVWFVVCLQSFVWLFHRSRVTGQFARNDT